MSCCHSSSPQPEGNTERPARHMLLHRRMIERVDGWGIYGHDRTRGDYERLFQQSETPVQIARYIEGYGWVSILTPCRQTGGAFELHINGQLLCFKCYRCAEKWLARKWDISLPDPREWIVYMLLESVGYLKNPYSPKEPSRRV